MSFREHVLKGGGRSALILGATGATGSQVLKILEKSGEWERIVVLGRRPVETDSPKVENVVMDLKNDQVDVEKLKNIDHFFNCIGTTRSVAGGPDQFHEIEVGISEKVAKAAKEAGVTSASVVSAQGADADRSVAPKWFHPLFYGKTIGLKERAMTSQQFAKTTIFRPGMLNREGTDRFVEKCFAGILPSLKTSVLAKAMVRDAETSPPEPGAAPEKPLFISGNGLITKYANL